MPFDDDIQREMSKLHVAEPSYRMLSKDESTRHINRTQELLDDAFSLNDLRQAGDDDVRRGNQERALRILGLSLHAYLQDIRARLDGHPRPPEVSPGSQRRLVLRNLKKAWDYVSESPELREALGE